jgi:hypothetical protein
VALVRTDVSEEHIDYIRVTRIGELGTIAVTSTLMMEAIRSSEMLVFTSSTRLKSKKTTFFILTAMKTTNPT